MKIGFNRAYLSGKELTYIADAIKRGKISGDGYYTHLCHLFFQKSYNFKKVLLTSSCTDALEMAAILLDIKNGDEVIVPSYTFVSTANAFVLRGAKIVFAESQVVHPNIDADRIRPLITQRTKAIVVVHYAGVACDMDKIMSLANEFNLFVIEDAAQGIHSFYKGRPLGSIGHMGCLSFHETKNVVCGEGGLLIINDERFIQRAEIVWEKGTNRSSFFKGEIESYQWVDLGSSYLLSDLNAAFLYAQLEMLSVIQNKRLEIWNLYSDQLAGCNISLPYLPDFATNNAHNFYLMCESLEERKALANYLFTNGIQAASHYLPLHSSPFYKDKHDDRLLVNASRFSDCLLRLPFYYELSPIQQNYITKKVKEFFALKSKSIGVDNRIKKLAI